MRLKAHALYVVLMVSILVALLSSAFILLTFYYQGVENTLSIERKLRANSNSGINYLLANPSENGEQVIDLFGEEQDSVLFKQEPWGLYTKITSTAIHGARQLSLQHLIGGKTVNQNLALYLSNSNKALGLVGSTVLGGDVTLPEKGVERAYVENKSFVGSTLFKGNKQVSSSNLPPLSAIQLTQLRSYFSGVFKFDRELKAEELEKEIKFDRDSIYLITAVGDYTIPFDLEGNIIVQSSNSLVVPSNIQLKNVILVASHIDVDNGFEGSFQAFGRDSISVGRNVNLNYPTVLAVDGTLKGAKITVGEDAQIKACIVALQEQFRLKDNSYISIGSRSEVKGQIYAGGYLQLQDTKIKGQVYANKLILKTRSSVYENLLMDVQILPNELDSNFSGLLFQENIGSLIIE